MTQKWSQSGPKGTYFGLTQNDQKMNPKVPKMVMKCSKKFRDPHQNGTKSAQNDPKITPKCPKVPPKYPLWAKNGSKWPKIGPKWAKNGSFLGDFGPFLGCFGVTLGSLWSQFGIVLASFWGCFEVVSTSFWGLLPHFWVILGLFCVFTVFLWIFGAVLRLPMQKFTKMRQYSASICNFFVKIDQKMGKFIQKQAFYRLLNTCIA